MSSKSPITTSVVLPPEMKRQIAQIAKAEGRSVTGQVRVFLADAVLRRRTANAKAA